MNQNLATEKYSFPVSYRGKFHKRCGATNQELKGAVIHKDYAVPYPTQISVYNDKLMIWNAGVLPEDWTTETLLGKHTSEPYNPLVAKVFYRAGDIETWGRGMEKVIDACKENDFPSPVAYTQGSGLWVVFNYSDAYVNKLSAIDRGEKIWFDPENGMGSGTVNGIHETINGIHETVNETCLQILAFVARNNNVTSIDLLQHIAVSRATLFRAINFLSSANVHLLKREGARKTGHYALTEDGELFYEKVIKRQ